MVKMINEFAERCARKHPVMDYSFGSSTVPAALKHICLNLPTLDLVFFTTALLTDNMSHEDYARWLLAQLFPGPATKVHQQLLQVFHSLRAQPDPWPGDFHT